MVSDAPVAPPPIRMAVTTAPKNCNEIVFPAVKLTITVLLIKVVDTAED